MPATEAAVAPASLDTERASYELAFHVLPTVAEGEVAGVAADLKSLVEKAGATILSEEAPQRFDLAYDIVKHVEGRNRTFSSAYFGWIRFSVEPAALDGLTEEVEADRRVLRYLIIRLTRVEEQHPFFFHEAIAETKVKHVSHEDVADADRKRAPESGAGEGGEKPEVDDEELDEALKKDEA